jgi:mRNA interferase RelE/StbE
LGFSSGAGLVDFRISELEATCRSVLALDRFGGHRYRRAVKTISYRGAAKRALRKLPAGDRRRIEEKLRAYARTGAGDVKPLVGRDGVRLRVGDYRVIFVETATIIDVMALGHRRDVYR